MADRPTYVWTGSDWDTIADPGAVRESTLGDQTAPPGVTPLNLLLSSDTAVGTNLVMRKANNGPNTPSIAFLKSRGSAASPSVVSAEDQCGGIVFLAYDGTTYVNAAGITSAVDGTPGASDMPGRISLNTTSDGSSTWTERVRVDSTGRVRILNSGVLEAPLVQNAQTTSYTLVLADAGKLVEMNSGSAITLTIPTNASVPFPTGTKIDVLRVGAGDVTIAGAGGVTVNSEGSKLKINSQWQAVTLIKRATDIWVVIGALKA